MKIVFEKGKKKKRKRLTFLEDGISMPEFLILIYTVPNAILTVAYALMAIFSKEGVPPSIESLLSINIPIIASLITIYTGGQAYVEGKVASNKSFKQPDDIDPNDMM